MNPKVKAQWVSALRSGKYHQGKNLLRPNEDTYCCLGVLCDLAEKESIGKYDRSEEHMGYTFWYDNSFEERWNEDSELPYPVMKWAKLESENPKIKMNEKNIKEGYKNIIREDSLITLAELNDNFAYNFNELANLIEEQL